MQIVKLFAAFSMALVCLNAGASPILQLGITNGSYSPGSKGVITTDNIFMLNAYGRAKGKNAASFDTNYILSIAILVADGLDPDNFGSFMLGANTYSLSDMVFGTSSAEAKKGEKDGNHSAHGMSDTWFLQYAFQFTDTSLTSDVNVENSPAFDPLATTGSNYYFKSFNVNTLGLGAGYNLHFGLFSTQINNKGNQTIDSHAPFSHDASTAYISSVPEPSTFAIFALALAGLYFSRKLVWPSAVKVKVKE